MKRITVFIFALIFAATLPLTASATDTSGNIYTINGTTVEFAIDSSFTEEEQIAIAELVVNGNYDSSITTYNLLCTLFGHKETTESYTVIEHCVSATAPRCVRSLQEITICSRCETVIEINILSSNYIFCCE